MPSLRGFLLRYLGVEDHAPLIAGLRADLEAHGKAHSGVLLDAVQQMQTTSTFAVQTRRHLEEFAYRLSVYESGVPQMAKIKKAMDAKATRRNKKAAADAAAAELARAPMDAGEGAESSDEMAVSDGAA